MNKLIIAVILMCAALAGCSAPEASGVPPDLVEGIDVAVAVVAMTDVATAIDSGGVVQARTTAAIAARILAPVRDVLVSPGDRVRKGQPLIMLASADLAAAARAARSSALAAEQGARAAAGELRAAEAGLVLARASHERIAGLQARRSATAQELDDAIAALRSAEARVAAASARVSQAGSAVESAAAASDQANTAESFATIAAPFDGIVTAKMVEPGNMALPGQALLRVEDVREFRLEVRVDESRVGQVRTGDRVPVLLGSGSLQVTGTVAEVSRAVDADARAFLVKIVLPDADGLRSGEFGRARFSGPSRPALTIPVSAVVRRGQLTSVFVVEEGRARMRLVSLSESEVLAGLTESEVVILAPPAALTDGRRVTVGGR
jgi:RND family efflux transporter MFP subunit